MCQCIKFVFRSDTGPKTFCLKNEFRLVWFEVVYDNKLRIIDQTRSCVKRTSWGYAIILVLFNIIINYMDEGVKMALIKFPNDTK